MPKILVVDDERDVVELLSFILSREGFAVVPAFNGKEALEIVGIMPSTETVIVPDLVILDIMMPGIDGYTVQNKMLENEKTNSIPILILTAKGQMKELFGMASNVVAYVEKPFDPKLLREKVKEIVNK